MEQVISVIVPVYNGEKYLRRCLDSIISQTYKSLEIILIDDGSIDSSASICEEYASKDTRIRFFKQPNMGQGKTRCKGIELSTGDYVAFVDGDDYILPNMYEKMHDAIVQNGTDICVCQWNYELPDGRHTINNRIYDTSFYGVKSSIEFERYLYQYSETEAKERALGGYANGLVVSPWNKLYKRSIIKGIQSSGYIAEDEEMNDQINSKNIPVVIIPEELYYWCQNLDSMSNKPFSEKRFHFLDVLVNRCALFSDQYIQNKTRERFCVIFVEYWFRAEKAQIKFPGYLHNKLRLFYCKLSMGGSVDWHFRLRLLIFIISPYLYKKIIKINV